MKPRFISIADHSLLVEFSSAPSSAASKAVAALDNAIERAHIPGVIETIPAIVNLLVRFDPLLTDHAEVQSAVQASLSDTTETQTRAQTHIIGVCYDPSVSPDLTAVAKSCNLSEDAVIKAHLAGDYSVLMYGFAPGFAYLGGVGQTIQVPRKPTPVRDVPTGSVIIAGPQCLITSMVMPTGWSIIGRSPAKILQDDPTKPFLFDVGDNVRFERISLDALQAQTKAD